MVTIKIEPYGWKNLAFATLGMEPKYVMVGKNARGNFLYSKINIDTSSVNLPRNGKCWLYILDASTLEKHDLVELEVDGSIIYVINTQGGSNVESDTWVIR